VKIFRAMKVAADGMPEVGPSARTLGVRRGDQTPRDVPVAVPDEAVPPQSGGMSVAPDNPANLPKNRRPPAYGGSGKDPVWVIDTDDLPAVLEFRQDAPTHGLVEPATNRVLTLAEYEAALASTRDKWQLVPPGVQGT